MCHLGISYLDLYPGEVNPLGVEIDMTTPDSVAALLQQADEAWERGDRDAFMLVHKAYGEATGLCAHAPTWVRNLRRNLLDFGGTDGYFMLKKGGRASFCNACKRAVTYEGPDGVRFWLRGSTRHFQPTAFQRLRVGVI